MKEPRCPDCDEGMEAVDLDTGDGRFSLVTGHTDAVLDAAGVLQVQEVEPTMCPECGLVRLYADAG